MNRREALRTVAVLGGMGALAVAGSDAIASPQAASNTDPCLAFVTGWNDALEACLAAPDREADAFYDKHCQPFEETAAWGTIPAATTAAGAIAALQKALAFDEMENQHANLVRAALAYLEGLVP